MSRAPLTTLKVTNRIRPITEDSDVACVSKSSRPKAQTERSNARNKENQEAIESVINEWLSYTNAKAAELADCFDKKPHYFLDCFFQGGQKLIYKQTVTNPFNAFISIKAAELHADGEHENAIQIQKLYKDEYDALSVEERAQYVTEFEAGKDDNFHVRRHTSRGCIQDIANIARNMEMLLDGLKTHVGIEGFFCIVCNNAEFYVNPIWYFTAKEISEYMPVAVGKKWSTSTIVSKLEAFAIAGCDVINLNRTSQQKANHMKWEISNIIANNLATITGNPKAVMQYANYEAAIVIKYGIELIGWTHEKFCNPSELSNSLEPLHTLLNALNNQSCKFVALSPLERCTWEAKHKADIASGAVIVKQCKSRKDIGTKRKGPSSAEDDDDSRPGKHIRSTATINDNDNDISASATVQGALPE